MRTQFIKMTAACVLTALTLYTASISSSATASEAHTPGVGTIQPVTEQAQRWVNELAVQSEFADWKKASLEVSPVGPGTHSWLVLVIQNSKTVGYLIVQAVEEGGYQLGEYGTGTQPLFDKQTLSRSIKQLELMQPPADTESLYVHPLLAAWKMTADEGTYYTDAASGELLPVQTRDWLAASSAPLPTAAQHQAPLAAKLDNHVKVPSFNPYDRLPWLTQKPLEISTSSYTPLLTKINSKEQLRYSAELFDEQMRYTWSVVGYDKWSSGHIYVALEAGEESAGRRYIPLLLLIELGSFYL